VCDHIGSGGAAVDDQGVPGDHLCVAGREEQNCASNIGRTVQSSEGDSDTHALFEFLEGLTSGSQLRLMRLGVTLEGRRAVWSTCRRKGAWAQHLPGRHVGEQAVAVQLALDPFYHLGLPVDHNPSLA
jgi:hypothetical protein